MPNRTIYIRKDDLAKWEAIKDKPLWIHNSLNIAHYYKQLSPAQRKDFKNKIKEWGAEYA